MTKYLDNTDPAAIQEAAFIIASGGLVAFPTETVYGLGANAMNESACKQIFEAKGRPADNPLIIHIADLDMLSTIISNSPTGKAALEKAMPLIQAFWPGPLTLIFEKSSEVNNIVSGGLSTVAVRMPDNPAALALIAASGRPIAAPSANISGSPSPTTAAHVKADLDGKISMILDGGPTTAGLESTILDLTTAVPTMLRPGHITPEMLEELLGPISLSYETALADKEAPKAPGMKYRHYAPKAKLTLVKTKRDIRLIKYIMEKATNTTENCAVLAPPEFLHKYSGLKTYSLTAENLFSALRQLDSDGITHAFIHSPKATGIGLALLNRLSKATGGNTVDLDTVLFVCTGNTCRSPMAAAVWDSAGTGCNAKSRGIAVIPNSRLSENSSKALESLGLSLTNHTPTQVTINDVEEAALVLCMTKNHATHLKSMGYPEKVFTLAEYSGVHEDVPDPYGADLRTYHNCAETIKTLIEKIIEDRKKREFNRPLA